MFFGRPGVPMPDKRHIIQNKMIFWPARRQSQTASCFSKCGLLVVVSQTWISATFHPEGGRVPLHLRGCVPGLSKVRLSSLTVLISFGSSSTTPRSGQNPSDSLCTGLWVPFRVFGIRFGPVLGPNPIRNRRFPAGSFEMFGARAAQPRRASSYPSYVYDWRLEAGGQRKNHSGFSRLDYPRRSMTTHVTAI